MTKQKNYKMASCENEKLTKQQADKTTQIKSRVDQMTSWPNESWQNGKSCKMTSWQSSMLMECQVDKTLSW